MKINVQNLTAENTEDAENTSELETRNPQLATSFLVLYVLCGFIQVFHSFR